MQRTPDGKMPGESHCSPRICCRCPSCHHSFPDLSGRFAGPFTGDLPELHRWHLDMEADPIRGPEIRENQIYLGRFKDRARITCNARMGSRESGRTSRKSDHDHGVFQSADARDIDAHEVIGLQRKIVWRDNPRACQKDRPMLKDLTAK